MSASSQTTEKRTYRHVAQPVLTLLWTFLNLFFIRGAWRRITVFEDITPVSLIVEP